MSIPSQQSNRFAIRDVCIFTGHDFIEHGHVVVDNGNVSQVGSGELPASLQDLPSIARPGHTLMPGLIDSHIHALFGNVYSIEQSLRFGVTTVCDMHNEPIHIARLQELASNPDTYGKYADFKCAGIGATIRGGWPEPVVLSHGKTPQALATIESWPKLSSPSDAAQFVDDQISTSGASYIKLFHELGDTLKTGELPAPPLDLQRAVVEAAHARGLRAVGHAFSARGATQLLEAGVDGLTHAPLDAPDSHARLAELCVRNAAHLNPTLSTCASQTSEGDAMQTAFAADPLARSMLFDQTPRAPLAMAAPEAGTGVGNAYACTRALYEAGVPIIVGSDSSGQARGTAYGLGVHMEVHLMVHKAGVAATDALKGATSLVAERFGFGDRGVVEAGRLADLVLVEGDVRRVLADERNLCLPVRGVWRHGVLGDVWKGTDAVARPLV